MPDLEVVTQSQFNERRGVQGQVLLWIVARDRSTGNPASIGLWSGPDHRDFTVEGETRTYFGAGNILKVAPIRAVAGLNILYHSVTLPPFTDEVRIALTQYDPRLAPAQLHTVPFNIDTNEPLQTPIRMVKGAIQNAPSTIGAKRTSGSAVTLKIASNTRRLHQGLPIYRSMDAHQAKYPGDLGREYVPVAPNWIVPWGDD